MGMMNRSMNLPQIQRIMQEFERESATMDMKEEMMGDAVDDVMDGEEGIGEEEEGDQILKEVLDEIGVSLGQQVRCPLLVRSASDLRMLISLFRPLHSIPQKSSAKHQPNHSAQHSQPQLKR